jgi:hypothetical protein
VRGAVGTTGPVRLLEGGVDHHVRLDRGHQIIDLPAVPDVQGVPRRADDVGRSRQVRRGHLVPRSQRLPDELPAEESATTDDEDGHDPITLQPAR